MKVRLLRDSRIKHYVGEIVEVSPSEYNFLLSVGSAEPVVEKAVEVETADIKPVAKKVRKKV